MLGGQPASTSEQLARVGFVAQDAPTYAGLSVADHLKLGEHMNPAWDNELAERRITQLGLDPSQKAGKMSGGAARPASPDTGHRQAAGAADPGRADREPGSAGAP